MPRARMPAALAFLAGLALAAPALAAPAYDELPDDRVLYVAPGQSLSALVRRLYPDRAAEWAEIRRWIVANNPHAFADGDPATLRADVRVELPHPSAFARRQQADAPAGIRFGRRYLFVDPAQSLEDLVPKVYPDARSRWDEIIDAIMARNEDVFAATGAGGTIGRGTRLSIPERAPAAPGSAAEPPVAPTVAEVVSVAGRVVAVGPGGSERTLAAGDPVRRHDTLRTGRDARAEIRFRDDERVFLRPSSELRVRAWRLPEVGPGERVLELVAGGLRAVTGAIGNRGADDYRTVTPNATMGVRGTAYAVRLCGEGECRMGGADAAALAPGLYVGVSEGRVAALNGTGEAVYAAGEYGYVPGPASAPRAANADVAAALYTAGERAALDAAGADDAATGDDGPSWWWALGGAALLVLAL